MKRTTFFKSLLVAAGLFVGANAWAADKTVVKYSFDDAQSPSLTAGSRVAFDYDKTSVITSTKFLNAYNNANGDPGASTLSLGSTDLSGEEWTLSFEWAACGGCNSKPDHTILKAGDTNLFDISGDSNWNTTVTITYTGSDGTKTLPVPGCDKGKRFSAATGDQFNTAAYWHHIVVTGNASGVTLTITNSNSGTSVVENVQLSETNVSPTSLIIEPCCGGAIGLDELSLSYYVEGEVVQNPVPNYSGVNGDSRTITATCETEDATIQHSADGVNFEDGASITVSESGKVYFKAVKGTSESDVVEFDVVAGEAIVLNAPVINRTSDTSVTISADQANLLLSPTATIYYEYGEESGSFTGSKTLTVEADATITAYAEADGYTTSETSERAVALFPTTVEQMENTAVKTSGWDDNAFSEETITASERTYAALLLDNTQWGKNVFLQTDGAWGLRASGNWYINSDTQESWLLMQDMKAGDIIVVNVTYPASSMVNATYSKYSYGTRYAYEVTEDGDVELAFKKINAATMDYIYGVYSYRIVTSVTAAVTSIGYATFCSPYALDFSNATSIEAYTAKVGDDGKITFTKVETVAAGEGVLLKSKDGKEAEEEIPVIASAEANANNDFVGIPETVQLAQTADGATNYILTKVDDKLGFYMVNANGSWCKGGTAYLKVSSAKARAFYSLDNDTTTAISDELVETESDAAVFNLNGQRVAAPQKGLYIVNGKKVVVK